MASVAAYVLERLRQWGVRRVYGYPGDGINGFPGDSEEADRAVGSAPSERRPAVVIVPEDVQESELSVAEHARNLLPGERA